MKQKSFAVPCILLLAITLIIASCSKTGPAGAAGSAGAQGPVGPNGPTGPAGPTGTANVIYSNWLNVKFQGTDSTGWFAQITANALTDSIINKGDVKVYFNLGSDSADNQLIFPLPIDDILLIGALIDPYYESKLIHMVATVDVSSDSLRGYHYFQYRYILIPGGINTGGRMNGGINATVNWNDYKQVKKYLGLKN
jgi:hypothetical protein